jgi:hypothetical protein
MTITENATYDKTEKRMKIAERDRAKVTELIRDAVSAMNGWHFSERGETGLCQDAADKVIRYMRYLERKELREQEKRSSTCTKW